MEYLPYCECGCKKIVTKQGNRFIRGHSSRKKKKIETQKNEHDKLIDNMLEDEEDDPKIENLIDHDPKIENLIDHDLIIDKFNDVIKLNKDQTIRKTLYDNKWREYIICKKCGGNLYLIEGDEIQSDNLCSCIH